ncbi:Ribosomal RNA small subunit methyltransferase E [Sinobacterium norvegicum]|uniref:Ribosomal RNA small subunit methyltransferase E n=1 Tax=Sinobacterium norvegicum TaxID=1641715 RepID=A0ABN8EKJ5_9GAMM|nr:16S rRNA (uracil(1498)-N(3))-methyltransferase [Sinobacterium norvegicum]CAH0992924.1 Ribosomal RNA small subunit methyltransferase E [Sinobacterium norvegicum]
MRIPRIFCSIDLADQQSLTLDASASHHLAKVLRFKAGYHIIVFNGRGQQVDATIVAISKQAVTVQTDIVSQQDNQSPLKTVLAIALSKGDRFDWVLQKATELGVHEIYPLFSERSEVKLSGERLEKKQQAWQKIIISACEQCQRNTLPILHPAQALENWVQQADYEVKLVLHHRSDQGLAAEQPTEVALLIGPEGGLSEAEIQLAEQHGFAALTLGPRVLRTETAPLTALSILQYRWGDF